MDARPVWHGNQHWGPVLPMSCIRVCLLPVNIECGRGDYELVRSDVWGDSDHRGGVLCVSGTPPLHPARGAGEARDVTSTHFYNCYVIERGESNLV